MLEILNYTEIPIVRFFNQLGKGTIIDSFSWLISWYPFMAFVFVFFASWIILNDKKRWKVILTALMIVLILHFAITGLLMKTILVEYTGLRERPYLVDGSLNAIDVKETDSAFPSGHVTITVALSIVFIYFYRKKITYGITGIFILLMAFSRMHNGMHYPSDILGGIVFGLVYGFVAIYFSKALWEKTYRK